MANYYNIDKIEIDSPAEVCDSDLELFRDEIAYILGVAAEQIKFISTNEECL